MPSWQSIARALCIGFLAGALTGIWATLGAALPRSADQGDVATGWASPTVDRAASRARAADDRLPCPAGATCGERHQSPPLIEPTALPGRE